MTSSGHGTIRLTVAISYRLPIGDNPLPPLVSKIFSLKDADIAIQPRTDILVVDYNNKECLMFAARISMDSSECCW